MPKKYLLQKILLLALFVLVVGVATLTTSLFLDTGSATENFSITSGSEAGCVLPIPNTTFLKTYRLLVFTKIKGAWPTKDGGYIISGVTDPNIMFVPPDGFVAKLDKQGKTQWVRLLKTKNVICCGTMMNPMGEEDVQSIIELESGGYLMVSYLDGFTTVKDFDADNIERNKVLFTRLDKNGNMVWNKSFTAFVEDARNSLLETSDGGFLFYAPTADLAPDKRGEDSDVYQDMPFASLKVLKFDKNANLEWAKNIKNFISRESDAYLVATPDGGYALAGNVAETNLEKELPYNFDKYPGIVKFDKDFNFQWAKSMEGTPLDMAAAIPKAGGGFEMGWKKWRQGAINVRGLVRTPDNGYLVLGQWAGGLSLMTDTMNLKDIKSVAKNSYLIGFKFDSAGKVGWVRKLTFGFNDFSMPMTDFSLSETTDDNVIVAGPMTWADDDYQAKTKSVNDLQKWYVDKYGEMEMLKENNQKSKESQQDWKKVKTAIKIAQDAFRPGIFMVKVDQDLNAKWAKIVNPQRGVENYVLKSTADSGTIIAGEHTSTDIQSVILDSITYYKDGFLMKLDASGNAKDNKNWIIDYNGKFITEIMTPYTVSNDLTVQVEPYLVNLTKRKPEFSFFKKTKTTTFAQFKNSKTTLCSVQPETSANDTPLQNTTSTSATPRTWPQINYEKAIPAELVNDKSKAVHSDFLPILNQLYNNQVKMTDNMGGTMLRYMFDRVITKDDVMAVKNYLVGVGYKTQDEITNQLTMYKPGYFLVITFSVNNQYKAFLDITY